MEAKKSAQADETKIRKFIYGYADSLVLKCSVELEIADTIHNHGKPMTLSELASQLPKQPIHADRLHRVMRYLVLMKFCTKEKCLISGEFKYMLLPRAMFLLKGWQNSMVSSLLVVSDKDFTAPWHYLKDGLTGESDPFEMALGMKVWEYMSEKPYMNQLFNEAMAFDTRVAITALIEECKDVFRGIKTLVDVGGGTGTAVKAISDAFPDIKCAVYDLPHVIADSPVAPNIERIEGDMFKSIPNADAIFMKFILHDWNDEKCIEILKQCKRALPDDGKVIIVDIVLNVDSKHPYTKMRLITDLEMMLCGGKERSEEEWKQLFEVAGFSGYKIIQISALQSVIEAYPY